MADSVDKRGAVRAKLLGWATTGLVIGLVILARLSGFESGSREIGYAVGDVVTRADGVPLTTPKGAVVMWIDPSCSACEDSLPLYKQLRLESVGQETIALGRVPVPALSTYLAEHHLTVDSIVSTGGNNLKFRAFPTLLFLDAKGRVTFAVRGRPASPRAAAAIVRQLR